MSETGRCEICDWPLKERTEDGCVEGNCSYRPPDHSPEWYRIQKRRQELKTKQEKEFWDGEEAFVESRNPGAPKPQGEPTQTQGATDLPPLDVTEEEKLKASRLKGIEIITHDALAEAFRELASNYYCRERQLREALRSAALHESTPKQPIKLTPLATDDTAYVEAMKKRDDDDNR